MEYSLAAQKMQRLYNTVEGFAYYIFYCLSSRPCLRIQMG